MNLVNGYYTVAVHIAGGPRAMGAEDESQCPFAPFIAHAQKMDSHVLLVFRLACMRCEKDVCGFVARPGYVNKDHCPALAISESYAWHGKEPGV